jgi:hypothetical protein
MKQTAWVLSVAGLVPFVGLALATLTSDDARMGQALLAYAAAILSFLGGIQWGVGLSMTGDQKQAAWVLGISVFPSLIAWSALLQDGLAIGYGVALGGLLSALAVDRYLMQMELLPAWFWTLRTRITALACASLALAILGHAG